MAAHGQQGLLELIEKLNNGEDFDMAYGNRDLSEEANEEK